MCVCVCVPVCVCVCVCLCACIVIPHEIRKLRINILSVQHLNERLPIRRVAKNFVTEHVFHPVMLPIAYLQTHSVAVCCSESQRVAVCWSVLQCVAVCCSALQVCCSKSRHGTHFPSTHASHCVPANTQCCSVLQCAAVCCSVLQCVAVCCSVLQCVAIVLQQISSRNTFSMHPCFLLHTCKYIVLQYIAVYRQNVAADFVTEHIFHPLMLPIAYLHMNTSKLLCCGFFAAWLRGFPRVSLSTCQTILIGCSNTVYALMIPIAYLQKYDVAVCCSVLQCVAVCCKCIASVLQQISLRNRCCSVLQCVAVCCSVLQFVAVCCSVLQVCCSRCRYGTRHLLRQL